MKTPEPRLRPAVRTVLPGLMRFFLILVVLSLILSLIIIWTHTTSRLMNEELTVFVHWHFDEGGRGQQEIMSAGAGHSQARKPRNSVCQFRAH